MSEVALLAYGAGNLTSVEFALDRLGARVRRVSSAEEIAAAERLILPGVGAAGFAMARLEALDLVDALRAFPRPLLGVCLGQQLLFESSDEGDARMLGLLPGHVTALVPDDDRPVPHVGWSPLVRDRDDPLMEGVATGEHVYFVHGFVCPDGPDVIAHADYGVRIPALVGRGNRRGCQFHPERSGTTGARILRNFLELPA